MKSVYFFEIPNDFDYKILTELKLKHDSNHLTSLLGREIVKTVAKNTLNTEKSEMIFETTKNGKPYLKDFPSFNFNISHSNKAVAVAFSELPIGIDIEKISEYKPKVAERYFSQAENSYINNSKSKAIAFYEIWTKKEAYFKCDGKGIGASFSKICVLSEDINKNIHTKILEDYIISVYTEDLKDIEFNIIKEDFFDLKKQAAVF